MKNAKHAENLKSFVKKVLKESKKTEGESNAGQIDPKRAIVRAVLTYDTTEARADEAMVVIDREFCDLNELRVATELELQDMLGVKYPGIEQRALKLVAILNAVFEKEGTLSFERVKALPKKEVRQYLRDLPEMTPYIEAYAMLHGFDAPAVPVDAELVSLLADAEACAEDATPEDVQKSLENLLKAEEMGDFHAAARKVMGGRKKK